MKRRSRKTFVVPTGRVVAKPTKAMGDPPRDYRYEKKAGRTVGGRKYTGGRTKDGTKTRTEMQKMLDRMREEDRKRETVLNTEPMGLDHTKTYTALATRVDEDVKWGKRGINTVGYVKPPHTDKSGAPHTYHETIEKNKKHVNETGQSKVSHKLRVTTGRPTTRAIWDLVKGNGLNRLVMYDSRIKTAADKYDFSGVLKDFSHGFNSRKFAILSAASFITNQDIIEASGVNTNLLISDTSQRHYASILDTSTEMLIHNQSRFHSAKYKIHIVRRTDSSQIPAITTMMNDINDNVFNNTITGQDPCAVPVWYQHSTTTFETSVEEPKANASNQVLCDMSLKGRGLLDSSYFRDHYEIVKTSNITLLAGEYCKYRHTHCFGPGFDLAHLCDVPEDGVGNIDRLYDPVTYFYILEMQGAELVEGTYTAGPSNFESYIGTAPGFTAVEVRKSLRYAKPESGADDLNTGGVFDGQRMHMRVWRSDPSHYGTTFEKEFWLPTANISATQPAPTGNMNIFSRTDQATDVNIHGSRVNT